MDMTKWMKGSPQNDSKKIDKRSDFGRLLGTPTRRRDEKPGGRRDSKEGLNEAGAGHPEEPH